MTTVYTIGYATKPIDIFVEQLKHFNINAVADVRSVPYSKVFVEYHKEAICHTLQHHRIDYVYLGAELGPRSKDHRHYDANNQVQFDRLMASPFFIKGIERLRLGLAKGYTIAMMCAEKDAAVCHRSLLIGHYLLSVQPTWEVRHITHDGLIEKQDQLEDRIVTMHGAGTDLFTDEKQAREQSYAIQLQKTAYIKP